jgi:hypothetical protein
MVFAVARTYSMKGPMTGLKVRAAPALCRGIYRKGERPGGRGCRRNLNAKLERSIGI